MCWQFPDPTRSITHHLLHVCPRVKELVSIDPSILPSPTSIPPPLRTQTVARPEDTQSLLGKRALEAKEAKVSQADIRADRDAYNAFHAELKNKKKAKTLARRAKKVEKEADESIKRVAASAGSERGASSQSGK